MLELFTPEMAACKGKAAKGKDSRVVNKLEAVVDFVNEEVLTSKSEREDSQKFNFQVHPEDVKELLENFSLFDTNNDKALDLKELANVMRALGQNPTRTQLQKIMAEADVDGSGKIEEGEYIDLLMKHMKSQSQVENDLKEAFIFFTKDSGSLTKETIEEILKTTDSNRKPLFSEEEAAKLISLMDKDKDGEVDIDEFVQFLCKPVKIDVVALKRKRNIRQTRNTKR